MSLSPTQPSPPFNSLSLHSNSHELSPPTTPIPPAPSTLSSQYHDFNSQRSSSDAHIKRSRYDITSPQSPSIIQISKRLNYTLNYLLTPLIELLTLIML